MAVDKCFVPSDQLFRLALERNLRHDQLVQHGLPIRKGFWGMDGHIEGTFARNIRSSTLEEDPRDKSSFLSFLGTFFKKRTNVKENTNFLANNNGSKPIDNKALFRKTLGLECDIPAVLVVGGGDGMGKSPLTSILLTFCCSILLLSNKEINLFCSSYYYSLQQSTMMILSRWDC
jgi:hypothetical protein